MTICGIKEDINYWENFELKPIINNNLIGYFESDEGSTLWDDRSGLSQNMVVDSGAPTRYPLHSSGIFGKGIQTNGITDKLKIINNAPLTNQITFSFDIMPTRDYINEAQQWFHICALLNITGGTFGAEIGYQGWSNALDIKVYNELGEYSEVEYITPWNTGKYYNITGTLDSSGSVALYVNGNVVGTSSGFKGNLRSNNIFYFGGNPRYGSFLGAKYARVLIYNVGLNPTEVYYNYTHSPTYYMNKSIQ